MGEGGIDRGDRLGGGGESGRRSREVRDSGGGDPVRGLREEEEGGGGGVSAGEGVRSGLARAGRLGRGWAGSPGPLAGLRLALAGPPRRWLGRLAWVAPGVSFFLFVFELGRGKIY